jgi:hypothetical protein
MCNLRKRPANHGMRTRSSACGFQLLVVPLRLRALNGRLIDPLAVDEGAAAGMMLSEFYYGGEGGIRTASGLSQSATCRIHVPAVANKTSAAVAHRPISPDDY